MAIDEQIIGNLNPYEGNATVQVGGNQPFVFSPDQKAFEDLNKVTQDYAKEKKEEKAKWEENVANKIASVSKMDGVLANDVAALSEDKKKLIQYIKQNSYLLSPANQLKNPEKASELESMVTDYLSKVEKSKADNVLYKSYRETMKKPEYANSVMEDNLKEFLDKPIMEREGFSPISNPNEIVARDLPKYYESAASNYDQETEVSPDGSMITYKPYVEVDKDKFRSLIRTSIPDFDTYNKKVYQKLASNDVERQKLEEQNIFNEEDYLNSITDKLYKERHEYKPIVKASESYKAQQQMNRLEKQQQGLWDRTVYIQDMISNRSFNDSDYDGKDVAGINRFDSSMKKLREATPIQVQGTFELVDMSSVPKELISYFYQGNSDKDMKQKGRVYRVKNGNEYTYYPVIETYRNENGKVVKEYREGYNTTLVQPDKSKGIKEADFRDRTIKDDNTLYQQNEIVSRKYGYSTQSTSSSTQGSTTQSKGKLRGIDEMYYNPMGRKYNQGVMQNGVEKGHDKHQHIGFTDPNVALAVIKKGQELGLSLRENPYVEKVDPVHTKNSYHYANFKGTYGGKTLGKGLDISGDENKVRQLFEWVEATYGSGGASSAPAKPKSTATKPTNIPARSAALLKDVQTTK